MINKTIHTIKVKGEDYLIRDNRVDNLENQVTTSGIKVGGTPLGEYLKNNGIYEIDGGNLQDVLTSLFSNDVYPDNYKIDIPKNLTVTMNAPTITADTNLTVMEVGSTVTFTIKPSKANASANITYSGFDYGFSLDNDNDKDGEAPSNILIAGVKDTDSQYKLSCILNDEQLREEDVENESIETTKRLDIIEGDNKITVTATAPSFTGIAQKIDDIYACSSLGNTSEDEKVDGISSLTLKSLPKQVPQTKTIRGDYYAFIGYSDTVPTTSDEVREYIGNDLTRLGKGGSLSGTCDGNYMFICIPSNWNFDCENSMNVSIRNTFKEENVKDIKITLPNNSEMDYKCYSILYPQGVFKNLNIK